MIRSGQGGRRQRVSAPTCARCGRSLTNIAALLQIDALATQAGVLPPELEAPHA